MIEKFNQFIKKKRKKKIIKSLAQTQADINATPRNDNEILTRSTLSKQL